MTVRAIIISLLTFTTSAFAQLGNRGPGKGPPTAGSGSKYTYPQPPKKTPALPQQIDPAVQIPEDPQKSMWKLSNKIFHTGVNPNDVLVYVIDPKSGRRTLAGLAQVGEEIELDEVRSSSERNFYKFKWNKGKEGTDYWIDGVNIEYAGKK